MFWQVVWIVPLAWIVVPLAVRHIERRAIVDRLKLSRYIKFAPASVLLPGRIEDRLRRLRWITGPRYRPVTPQSTTINTNGSRSCQQADVTRQLA